MLRRAFNIWAIFSFVLCLAVAGLWVSNRSVVIDRPLPFAPNIKALVADRDIGMIWVRPDPRLNNPAYDGPPESPPPPIISGHDFVFGSYLTLTIPQSSFVAGTGTSKYLGIHDWFLLILFAILPGIWLVRRIILHRRMPEGCCRACGYDLRASKGACPECGTLIPPTSPAKPR